MLRSLFSLLCFWFALVAAQASTSASSTPAAATTGAAPTTQPSTPFPTTTVPSNTTGSGGAGNGTGPSNQTVPDVYLNVPQLSVGKIELDVDDLQADINLNAQVANLVT